MPIGVAVVCMALVFAGCGGAGDAAPGPPSTVSSGDRARVERRLVRYFERNFTMASWYGQIASFEVQGGSIVGRAEVENATVVVRTTLPDDGDAAAREICAGVFGADVADAGGAVRVIRTDAEPLAVCASDR